MGLALTGMATLTACAGAPDGGNPDILITAPTPPLEEETMDSSPHNEDAKGLLSQTDAVQEEPEMTVLVLEDPALLARAALMAPQPAVAEPTVTDDETVTRPDRMRFSFGFDAHRLSAEDEAILRQHGRYLAANPDVKVYLTGHTDSQGPDAYNQFLSSLRATAAARILREAGARADQIESHGVGSKQPLVLGRHDLNRRVELDYQEDPAT